MAKDEDSTADKERQLEEQEFLPRWEANLTPLQVYFRDARTYARDRVAADRNCPSEGYDWFQINGKWLPEAPGDELPKNTIFPALRMMLVLGICIATGRHQSANAKSVVIEPYAWGFLKLAATKFFTLVATNQFGEIFYDIRFFPPNDLTIKAIREPVPDAPPYRRRTLGDDDKKIDAIKLAFDELTSKRPELEHLQRPSTTEWCRWAEVLQIRANRLRLQDKLEFGEITRRQVNDYLSSEKVRDRVRAYLGLTGDSVDL